MNKNFEIRSQLLSEIRIMENFFVETSLEEDFIREVIIKRINAIKKLVEKIKTF